MEGGIGFIVFFGVVFGELIVWILFCISEDLSFVEWIDFLIFVFNVFVGLEFFGFFIEGINVLWEVGGCFFLFFLGGIWLFDGSGRFFDFEEMVIESDLFVVLLSGVVVFIVLMEVGG